MLDQRTHLELLVRARYALIVLETIEPELAERMVRHIASDLQIHYYSWTRSKGLRRGPSGGVAAGEPHAEDAKEPHKALACAEREGAGIFFFRELGPFLEDPLVASQDRKSTRLNSSHLVISY